MNEELQKFTNSIDELIVELEQSFTFKIYFKIFTLANTIQKRWRTIWS